ncbi:SURF1 family protein [Luteimonas sp. J29]|jgi:surfeit locus 1 family protein|nr:SURF1 family protein [Luteimonas sp. J29]
MRAGHGRVLGWVLALAAIALFASLGRWQLGRMEQKQAMLDGVERTLAARHALPLSAAGDPARARDFDWAAGDGAFADAPAVLLDNQQRDGRPGVRAYRLFAPAQGAPLLVELGWLPLPGDRTMPPVPRPDGEHQVQGLLLPPPSPGIASPRLSRTPGGGAVVSTALDAPALAEALGVPALPPRVLRLDPDLPLGFARDLDVLPNTLTPQQHLGYAVQWFGLALAVLATALILTFRRPRR